MRLLTGLICVGLLAGCAADGGDQGQRPGVTRVQGVSFIPQEANGCGPSSLAMALDWTGLNVTPSTLRGRFADRADPRPPLTEAASSYGRLAYPISGMAALVAELEAGHPVVVVQNLGVESRPIWTCSLAIGLDRANDSLIFHAGNQAGKRMTARTFERLWSDTNQWGLVVLRPGELPKAANLPTYLDSIRQLERAGRHWEAVMAYDAGLTLWPDDADALMGLGSNLYILGDRRGAAEAFRAAAAVARDPAPARAALTRVTAEQAAVDSTIPQSRDRR